MGRDELYPLGNHALISRLYVCRFLAIIGLLEVAQFV